jgi:hypothetical protein
MKQSTIDLIKRKTKNASSNFDAPPAKTISPKPMGARQLKTFKEFIKDRHSDT